MVVPKAAMMLPAIRVCGGDQGLGGVGGRGEGKVEPWLLLLGKAGQPRDL